jgi:hypothetical protein
MQSQLSASLNRIYYLQGTFVFWGWNGRLVLPQSSKNRALKPNSLKNNSKFKQQTLAISGNICTISDVI